MIFVTVGTHEQQFNRLIREIDLLKSNGKIEDEVIIQLGFSTYKPKNCKWSKLFSYDEMNRNIQDARVVVTHGGPASFIAPLQIGKIPIVVPRQKEFDEHVNDHQLEFCQEVEKRYGNIILVENIMELGEKIKDYPKLVGRKCTNMNSNNLEFVKQIELLAEEVLS